MKHKHAILFVQLGTPEAPTPKALKTYLREFLSDKRVVDVSPIIWKIILNLFILRKRPKASAKLYEEIWSENGSPLLDITKRQTQFFRKTTPSSTEVTFAMRYGKPSIRERLIEFKYKGIDRIYIVPLYPQYASSTTGSVMEEVYATIQHFRYIPSVKTCDPFYSKDFYIDGFVKNIRKQKALTPFKTLILSYHGIPKRYADLGDPYREMCEETTKSIKAKLSDAELNIIHSYQSRFGKEEWLKPYTDEVIKTLSGDIGIASPSFVSDCLETTHELGIELREEYTNGTLHLISCLNDDEIWLNGLKTYIESDTSEWELF